MAEKKTNKFKKAFLTAPKQALCSKGFRNAFLWSFGSFIAGWLIVYFGTDDVYILFGKYSVIIPLLNTIAVVVKQWIDAMRSK